MTHDEIMPRFKTAAAAAVTFSGPDAVTRMTAIPKDILFEIYSELAVYSVLHDITVSTPLTYPDIKVIRDIILEECGVGSYYLCQEAHSLPEIETMLSDERILRELYVHTGLDYDMLSTLRELVSVYARFLPPAHPLVQCRKIYAIDSVFCGHGGEESSVLCWLLPYKENILLGWHDKQLFYQSMTHRNASYFSGYHAVSLYLILQGGTEEELRTLCSDLECQVLNNDISGSSVCVGHPMSLLQKKKILSGYDPLDIISPIFLKSADWEKYLYPALLQFERHTV